MNEKEMVDHIKALTKVIVKQNDRDEQLIRRFYNMDWQITIIQNQLQKLQGIKEDGLS